MKSIINYSLLVLFLFTAGFTQAQLSEDFEGVFPPTGWTTLDNGVCLTNQWQKSTAMPNNGTSHAFVKFSNSIACEDWLVTPKLLPDPNNNSLSFYAKDAADQNYGSVYTVRVSTTSQSDRASFTTIKTYLESDFTSNAYQLFTVDLSTYNDQEIFVAFVLENSNGDSFFLDDVSGPDEAPVTTPPNCDAVLTQPANGTIEVAVETSLSWSQATSDPTGYKLRIGTSPGGSEFLPLTDVGSVNSYTPASKFTFSTTYYVTIIPYNTIGDAVANDCVEYSFTTESDPSIVLDCENANSDVTRTICYASSVDEEFTISANNSQVQIFFNAGEVENNQDEIYIYDGTDDTGILLNEGKLYGNDGNLTGLSYTSITGSLFIRITPDQTIDCQNGNLDQIEFTASCVDCNPPTGMATAGNCNEMNNQFYIDVDVTHLGDGAVLILNDQNAKEVSIGSLGIHSIGPFNFGTVTIVLENQFDAECSVELLPITVNGCAPANDECANATALTASANDNCANAVSGSTDFATASPNDDICSPDALDVWYSFTPGTTDTYVFELANNQAFTSIAVYEGSCASLTLVNEDCVNEGQTVVDLTQGQTYLVQVFTTDENFAGTFDLCVYASPAPPANDLCANATVISCPDGASLTGVDATYATDTDAASCNNDPIGAGVWYQIAGTGELLSITANPDNWDVEIQVWTGADCQNLTCVMQVDDETTGGAESISEFETVLGTNYYIYVGAFIDSEPAGLFDLTVSCGSTVVTCLDTPTNDPCNDIQVADGVVAETVTACETIVTSGAVTIESGTTASFEAGTSITLTTGFTAEAGSDFTASIVPCNTANEEEIIESRSEIATTVSELEVNVQPNPALGDMQVQVHLPTAGAMNMALTDISGKTVRLLQQDGNIGWNQFTLQRNDLADGMYFLTVLTASERKTIKVIFAK